MTKMCRVFGWVVSGSMSGNLGYPTCARFLESAAYLPNVGFVGFIQKERAPEN